MPSSYATQQIQAAAYQPSNVKYAIHTSQPAPNSYPHNVSPAAQASPSNLMTAPAPNNNYMYFPNPHHVQHPRFVNHHNNAGQVSATSPTWLGQQQAAYFQPHQMPPPMTYPQYPEVIQTQQQPPISNPQMMHSVTPPTQPTSAPSGRKSRGIVIKD